MGTNGQRERTPPTQTTIEPDATHETPEEDQPAAHRKVEPVAPGDESKML